MGPRLFELVRSANGGALSIMAKPSSDWLDEDMRALANQKVGVVVSLLAKDEALELGLGDEGGACARHAMEFLAFPITDRGTPDDVTALADLVRRIRRAMESGTSVVVHCRAGIGRSSLVAGAVMLMDGLAADEALATIAAVRGVRVPDTPEQAAWLAEAAAALKDRLRDE